MSPASLRLVRRHARERSSASDARLALLEQLLALQDIGATAQAVLRHLERTDGLSHALCALTEPIHGRLRGVAGLGQARSEAFVLALSDRSHPLVAALESPAPVLLSQEFPRGKHPLGGGPLVAVPLRTESEGLAQGLLLLRASALPVGPEVEWVARMLAGRLTPLTGSGDANPLEARHQELLALKEASAEQVRFLANMSHEMRTPLNAILGFTSMLLEGLGGPLAPGQQRHLDRVRNNAQHLLQLINDGLDIHRIDAGRMPLHTGPFSLTELASEVLSELEPVIARSKLAVTPKLPPGLPLLDSDRQKVKQILINLTSNALKFTHEGSVELGVRLERRRKWLALSVKDTGIGIAPEHHARIFEDFRQVDETPTRSYGGTGLGLSISRRLAVMLGGELTLESAPGKGSTFTLYLPLPPRDS
jgi:signal transduction histidine kinase